jgi:hypothetical protein
MNDTQAWALFAVAYGITLCSGSVPVLVITIEGER